SPRPPRSPDGAQRNPGAASPENEVLNPDDGPQERPSIRATELAGRGNEIPLGAILALAYPERIAKNRGAATGAFLLANGRGAYVDPVSALAREPFLAVAELIGSAAQSRITLATAIDLADIESRFADRIEAAEEVTCDAKTVTLRARRSR